MGLLSTNGIRYPEDLLASGEKLQFGNTVFAILGGHHPHTANGCHSLSDKAIKIWGPVRISKCREEKNTAKTLENILSADIALGLGPYIYGLLVDLEMAFEVYAEGLIIDNQLTLVSENLYEGRILLLGRVYKLLIRDGVKVTGPYKAVPVDSSMNILV